MKIMADNIEDKTGHYLDLGPDRSRVRNCREHRLDKQDRYRDRTDTRRNQ